MNPINQENELEIQSVIYEVKCLKRIYIHIYIYSLLEKLEKS